MTKKFDGKVALITGAARGQGRSHAIRFADEGADIIALDICAQIDSVAYPMATAKDLEETVRHVEKAGRRIVAIECDVRDFAMLQSAVADGVAQLGRIDFVVANAGIAPMAGPASLEMAAFVDAVAVMLNGAYYTVEAALPAMLAHGEGGAIVLVSSAAGLASVCGRYSLQSPGVAGYQAAKHGVVGLMRYYATSLAEKKVRVNTVHPSGVATPMLLNQPMAEHFAAKPEAIDGLKNLLDVELIDCADITEAIVYLCGDSGRYITGITLPVDAGYLVK